MTTIAELRRLLEAATPGPWSADDSQSDRLYPSVKIIKRLSDKSYYKIAAVGYPTSPNGTVGAEERLTNAALIAAAVNALPALLAVAEALERIDDELVSAMQADTENGVRWLNEAAAKDYLSTAPETKAAIAKVLGISRTALAALEDL